MQYSIKTYTRRISRYYEEIQIAINGYTMYNFDNFALNPKTTYLKFWKIQMQL